MSIKSELDNLKEPDIMSLLLFVLYKMKDSIEYSSLSELAFVLDKTNFLKLCEYFGGSTITIPKISELEILLQGILLYQYIDIDKLPYDEASAKLNTKYHMHTIKHAYRKIKEVLTDYTISPRGGA